MVAKTLTISIPEEMFAYLEKDGLLSPSKIFQQALLSIQDSRETLKEKVKLLEIRAKRYEDLFLSAVEFITLKNLGDEWTSYRG